MIPQPGPGGQVQDSRRNGAGLIEAAMLTAAHLVIINTANEG